MWIKGDVSGNDLARMDQFRVSFVIFQCVTGRVWKISQIFLDQVLKLYTQLPGERKKKKKKRVHLLKLLHHLPGICRVYSLN